MNFLKRLNKEILILFLFYFISNIFILINYNGIYWDDWTIYNHNKKDILSQFTMNGGLLTGYMHNLLLSFKYDIFIYRILVFILFFLSGIFIFKILKKLKLFSNFTFLIILVYLIVPLNFAKIALINIPSIIYLFLFYFAFYLLSFLVNKRNNFLLRLIILSLFFISFFLNSLLVFYAVVLLYIFYIKFNFQINSLQSTKQFFIKYMDFISLPIIFWIVKNKYFHSYGLYQNYNHINFDYVTFKLLIKSIYTSFIEPIIFSVIISFEHFYVFIIMFIISFIILKNIKLPNVSLKNILILLLIGMVLFFLAIFPYIAVHKLPELKWWYSRFQILLPLGFSFIYIGLLFIILYFNKLIAKIFLIISISIFLTVNYEEYKNYEKDWFYQIAIMNKLKQNNIIKENKTFIYNLIGRENLANDRNINFYQMNGFSRIVFKNSDKLFVQSKKELIEYGKIYKKYSQYNFYNWEYTKPIKINIVLNKIKDEYFYQLLFYYYFNIKKFNQEVNKIVTLRILNKEVK